MINFNLYSIFWRTMVGLSSDITHIEEIDAAFLKI